MENGTVNNYNVNRRRVKRSNTSATIGFLLTLLNIVVSIALIITGNTVTLMLFAAITAVISLVLCIVGVSNANMAGKGKFISVLGIILNVLILLAVLFFLIFMILFAQACAGIFQGIMPN